MSAAPFRSSSKSTTFPSTATPAPVRVRAASVRKVPLREIGFSSVLLAPLASAARARDSRLVELGSAGPVTRAAFRAWAESLTAAGVANAELGESLAIGSLGFFDTYSMAADTLGEGLERFARGVRTFGPSIDLVLEVPDDPSLPSAEAALVLREHEGTHRFPELVEAFFGIVASRCRAALPTVRFARVEFAHSDATRIAPCERAFGTVVVLGAAEDRLVFPAELLSCELSTANRDVSEALEAQYARLAHFDDPVAFVSRARAAVERGLTVGRTDVPSLARALGVSARTLQRRLEHAGSTQKSLLECARHARALELLHDQRLLLAEIAERLGYSDRTAFFRAFRRWTGMTPATYRRRVVGRCE